MVVRGVVESRVRDGHVDVGTQAELDGNNSWEELAEVLRAAGTRGVPTAGMGGWWTWDLRPSVFHRGATDLSVL